MTFAKVFASTAVIAAAIAGYAAIPARAAEAATIKPIVGGLFYVGSKRAVAYFASADNACKVSVLMADRFDETKADPALTAVRFSALVRGGTSAEIDTIDGPTLSLTCATDASSLKVQVLDRVAYAARAK
jgi:hypothetical protein